MKFLEIAMIWWAAAAINAYQFVRAYTDPASRWDEALLFALMYWLCVASAIDTSRKNRK